MILSIVFGVLLTGAAFTWLLIRKVRAEIERVLDDVWPRR